MNLIERCVVFIGYQREQEIGAILPARDYPVVPWTMQTFLVVFRGKAYKSFRKTLYIFFRKGREQELIVVQ